MIREIYVENSAASPAAPETVPAEMPSSTASNGKSPPPPEFGLIKVKTFIKIPFQLYLSLPHCHCFLSAPATLPLLSGVAD